ncbi:hypothetical protein SAMN02949497_3554 [Methylomagnum ishizawai]|uniref:Uncharacterized protein n=1 Tax=Methylomagnum ishizawai TaxID=1760988 RepID=A0A1Y6CZQ4_9GAMM|nr:hypothetical protein [Methylomagnum ishizawai]SMF96169.1 hypothetical protein SAMN02949497_3554 [Methylomagnum ishizawai]
MAAQIIPFPKPGPRRTASMRVEEIKRLLAPFFVGMPKKDRLEFIAEIYVDAQEEADSWRFAEGPPALTVQDH